MTKSGQEPFDEKRRLEALRSYGVLDTLPDGALDDLTALAAAICETPIALISLIDEKRQWFKSRIGLELAETALDVSICVHALHTQDLFIVPDTTRDERFARNPVVMGEHGIRFYAGAPLITPEGEALGTLCVLDRVPRTLTPAQEQALRVLARQVMTSLELRRQAGELAERERLLRTVFDSEPECVKLLGSDGALRMMNRAGLAMIGADSFEQVAGQCVLPLIATEHRALFEALIEGVFRGESETVEYEIVGLKGTRRWLETHAAPMRDETGMITAALGISRDVTERRRAAEELRASEARYRTLFEYAPDGIVVADAEGCYVDANVSACRMLGYTRGELIGLHISDIVTQTEIQHVEPALDAIKTGAPYHREWQFRRKDGSVFSAEVMATLMPDGKLLGMLRDITERTRSRQQIREQAALLDEARDAICVNDLDQHILFWNKSAERLYGWTAAEALGRNANDLLCQGSVALTALKTLIQYGEWHGELEQTTREGKQLVVESRWSLIREANSAAKSILVINTDVSEKKEMEAQFFRAQRMESIGTLAGGIAHDLNNTLGPIIMSLDLLKMKFQDQDSQELLAIVSSSAHRGADMVRQVLSFARGVEGRRMEIQIKHLLGEIEKVANDTFPKNIQVRTIIPYDLWTVLGDPTQLHQVLLNLCVNARDAMPHGGAITLAAENLTLDAHYAGLSWNREANPGPYVFVRVTDTGTGMPPEIMEKIFDPFFTTKELGKGTGLGLSTSLAIVKSHGGFIRVESELGKGAKFSVYLPAEVGTSPAGAAEAASEMPRGHGELILVVDDEAAVRQITEQTLQSFGYRVVLALDGAEAVAVYARQGAEIAAVVTDMMMPIMDGPATIQVLRRMNPAVRIIGVSGLSDPGHTARATGLGVAYFLPKPFTAETLLKALKAVLSVES
jgi:PAS domain S-box-containing protein